MSHLHVKSIKSETIKQISKVAGKIREEDVGETILVLADNLPDPETGEPMKDHPIYIPPEAIANRMLIYNLKTREEGLHAILCEHAIRLHGMDSVFRQGHRAKGDTQPEVTYAPKTKNQVKAVIDQHNDAIREYYTRTFRNRG